MGYCIHKLKCIATIAQRMGEGILKIFSSEKHSTCELNQYNVIEVTL